MPYGTTEAFHAFVIDIASKNDAALAWASVDAGWVRGAFAVMGMRQRCQLPNREFLSFSFIERILSSIARGASGMRPVAGHHGSFLSRLAAHLPQQIRPLALPVAMAALACGDALFVLSGRNLGQVSQRAPY